MNDKRDKISTDPGLGPLASAPADEPASSSAPSASEPNDQATLRSIPVAADAMFADPDAPVYVEPAPLVAVSKHKTLEIQTVKLAAEIDPRKHVTQVRLGKAPKSSPTADSGWPAQTGLSSSNSPLPASRRWRTPLLLMGLLSALLVLVVARAAIRRTKPTLDSFDAPVALVRTNAASGALPAEPSTTTGGRPAETSAGTSEPSASAASTSEPSAGAASTSEPGASEASTGTSASAGKLHAPSHESSARPASQSARGSSSPHSEPAPGPSAGADSSAAAAASKPKRAIY